MNQYFFFFEDHMYRKKKTIIDDNDDTFLQDLNSEQKRAVTCPTNQSTLVLSGAGLLVFVIFSF
jgi:hypothetical protein